MANCETHGCSHACFVNSINKPECACPKGHDLTSSSLQCEESNTKVISSTFIQEDYTWRPLLGYTELCVWKKFGQKVKVGHSCLFDNLGFLQCLKVYIMTIRKSEENGLERFIFQNNFFDAPKYF